MSTVFIGPACLVLRTTASPDPVGSLPGLNRAGNDPAHLLIRWLSSEERHLLRLGLKAEGCRDALVVWGNTLIDGHNRHKICTAHNIPFQTADREFIDRDDAKLWIIDNQLGRRNLTPFVRTELHLKKKAILAAEAKKKVVETGKQTGALKGLGKGAARRVLSNSTKPLVTLKKIAQAADVSDNTVFRVEKIIAKAPAPVLEKLRKGETSINEAYTAIKREEREVVREEKLAKITSENATRLPADKRFTVQSSPNCEFTSLDG